MVTRWTWVLCRLKCTCISQIFIYGISIQYIINDKSCRDVLPHTVEHPILVKDVLTDFFRDIDLHDILKCVPILETATIKGFHVQNHARNSSMFQIPVPVMTSCCARPVQLLRVFAFPTLQYHNKATECCHHTSLDWESSFLGNTQFR